MATREQLIQALQAADKAGDTAGAQKIAAELNAGNFSEKPQGRSKDEVMQEWANTPMYAKVGRSFDDAARLVASGLTGGWSDNFAGGMNELLGMEGNAETEKQRTDEARMRMGIMASPYEFMGMLLPASRLSTAAGAVSGMTGSGVMQSAGREALAGAAQSMGTAASDVAAGRGDMGDIVDSGVTGALGGGAGGAAGSVIGSGLNYVGKKLGIGAGSIADEVTPPKSIDQLRRMTNEAYEKVDNLGARYRPDDYNDMIRKMQDELNQSRINPDFHPKALSMLKILQEEGMGGGNLSPRDLDDLRRLVTREVKGSGGEDHMAGIMKRHLDDFIGKGPTVAGDAAEASGALISARDLARRTYLLDDINEQIFKGDNAASEHGDINTLRNLLNNKKKRKSMSKEELDALIKVVRGDKVEKALRKSVAGIPVTPVGAGVLAGSVSGNPMLGVAAGGATALAEPTLEAAAGRYTNANIKKLMDAVAMGKTIEAPARSLLPPTMQAAGVLATESEQKKKRKKSGTKRRKPLEITITPDDID